MADLVLHVHGVFFRQMLTGEKTEEYRRKTDYWDIRLNREYDRVIVYWGYPKRDDKSRQIVFKWNGATLRTITHALFGSQPVEVYAINLRERLI